MDYEHDYTFSGMYFATEIRFDGIGNFFKKVFKQTHVARPVSSAARA